MRRTATTMAVASAVVMAGYFQATASEDGGFASTEARESYAMGALIGEQLGRDMPDLDVATFLEGMGSALGQGEARLSQEQVMDTLAAYEQRQLADAKLRFEEQATKNSEAGQAFQQQFGSQSDVVTLDSGVQYQVIESGAGDKPGPDANVVVHYSGRLIDGTEFDSSYSRNEPASFPVSRVIPGWTEVLQEMAVGSKWTVVVPPELAYGERGAGPLIQPNATLVFDIELIEIS